MSRYPVWFIFIFVSCSILVTSGYNAYVMSPFAADGCAVENKGRALLFESELKSFPPIYREPRQRGGGDFSFACIERASTDHHAFLETRPAACGLEPEAVERSCKAFGGLRVTYNSILDIADCLEVSQREFLPLLASDNAFLPDLLPAARSEDVEALKTWPQDRALLATSEKASCRRLAQVLPADLRPRAEACPSMRDSVFHHLVLARRFARVSQEVGERWDASLLDSSLAEMDARLEDRLILRYWVHVLSQWTGSNKALSLAHEFVGERLDQNTKILPGELSWKAFTDDSQRGPSSVTGTAWSAFLKKRLDSQTMGQLESVAKWLSWMNAHALAVECAGELWTMD